MKRVCFLFSIILIMLSFTKSDISSTKNNIIVIDAGHGGMDSGCVYENIYEADINLSIANMLEYIFISNGYDVIMTRRTKDSLCEGEFNKKEDLNKRIDIINSSNGAMCISIHLNMFSIGKYKGAQVFYSNNNPNNLNLAKNIQKSMKNILDNTNREEKNIETIYILNRISIPSVIVECGFLSNDEERSLLINEDYQALIAYSIYYGCIKK